MDVFHLVIKHWLGKSNHMVHHSELRGSPSGVTSSGSPRPISDWQLPLGSVLGRSKRTLECSICISFLLRTHHLNFMISKMWLSKVTGGISHEQTDYNKLWPCHFHIWKSPLQIFICHVPFQPSIMAQHSHKQETLQNMKIQLKLPKIRRRQLSWVHFGIAGSNCVCSFKFPPM